MKLVPINKLDTIANNNPLVLSETPISLSLSKTKVYLSINLSTLPKIWCELANTKLGELQSLYKQQIKPKNQNFSAKFELPPIAKAQEMANPQPQTIVEKKTNFKKGDG